jgi:hypothetical protein
MAGKFVSSVRCLTTCFTGFWDNLSSMNCDPCDVSCYSCDISATHCTECPVGKFLLGNVCINSGFCGAIYYEDI